MTIMLNNLKRIFKSKSNIIIMFVMPMVFITIFMMGSFGKSKITVGIVDKDNTKFTKMLIDNVKQKNDIRYIEETSVKSKLINGALEYVLVIDKGFTKKIINNEETDIKGYGLKESNIALPSKYNIDSFINSAKNIGAASKGDEAKFYKGLQDYTNGSYTVAYTSAENTKEKGGNTLTALGFLIMSMIFLSNHSATLMLDDKKNKTFYRIFASPISTRNYMLQNILSFFLVLVIQLGVIFTIMLLGFKAYFGPSVLSMFALYAIFSLVCVSLGVAISTVAKGPRQAGSISTFITVPMCMLGGCFWPRDFMPDILLKISNFMPTTWVLRASQKLIDGSALTAITKDISVLLLFALVFVLLGSWKKADITK